MTVGLKPLAGLALAASLLLAGCGPKEPPPSETPSAVPAPPAPAPDKAAPDKAAPKSDAKAPATDAKGGDGKAVFTANCAKCHKLGDIAGGKAPDLTKIGAEKDAAWIEAHVKDPKAHKPDSRMPAFGGKLGDAEIKAVAEMLAGMK